MYRENLIDGLRRLADIYEAANEEILPTPYTLRLIVFSDPSSPEKVQAEVRAFIGAVGKLHKADSGGHIKLEADGLPEGVGFAMYVKKVMLGCRKVAVERTITEEVWQCGPLLDAIKEAT